MAPQTPTTPAPATGQRAPATPQPAAADASQELYNMINALRQSVATLQHDNMQLQQQIAAKNRD